MIRLWAAPSINAVFGSGTHVFFSAFSRDTPDGRAPAAASSGIDPAYKRVLMYLLVGSKGGHNRVQMIKLLKDEPMNANKMGERLGLDYKTIQHHLKILQENNMVVTSSAGAYGAMYFLTPYLEKNIGVLEEIWARFGKR
ncbi:MAG: winged helix-turn-helix domain-containing protein [Thaumarchaeota archaeon]|nr:winged helix-turn-helix domain-containing protein [Nitrososphaerota archaeon]